MPIYLFQNPKTQEINEVFFHMNDEKKYEKDGIVWNRIYTVPTHASDCLCDPFSIVDFSKSTDNKKLTIGDLFDKSAELSQSRADKNGGVDPVKQKMFDHYRKLTKKAHPAEKEIILRKKLERLGVSVS